MDEAAFLNREETKALFEALLSLQTQEECALFFRDLCTMKELTDMVDRFAVVRMVEAGDSYRDIAEKTGVSTTTVTRVAHWLRQGRGGYRLVLDRTSAHHHA